MVYTIMTFWYQIFSWNNIFKTSHNTQGAKPQCLGKPDMACCKRLCDKNIIHVPSGVNWSCTTLKICYWIGVVALITVPPYMTKRCYIKSQHNLQIYFIYLFLIKYKTTWYIVLLEMSHTCIRSKSCFRELHDMTRPIYLTWCIYTLPYILTSC